jgi:tRNA G18 (ribose-2'-O)-methylase SpoU
MSWDKRTIRDGIYEGIKGTLNLLNEPFREKVISTICSADCYNPSMMDLRQLTFNNYIVTETLEKVLDCDFDDHINTTIATVDKKSGNRGFFGICVYNLQKDVNYGSLLRSAACFDADFIGIIGKHSINLSADTCKSYKHIPTYVFKDWKEFISHIPIGCEKVAVELCNKATSLINFKHPERAIYILGPENGSLSNEILDSCDNVIQIPSKNCLNVSVAGSIVLYDRIYKRT